MFFCAFLDKTFRDTESYQGIINVF